MQRDIIVKMCVNPDEFLDFDHACKDISISHSAALRYMAKRFSNHRKVLRKTEWPKPVHHVQKHHRMIGFKALN